MLLINLTAGLLLLASIGQHSNARKTEILDENEDVTKIESITIAVCKNRIGEENRQISHFSTIQRLIDYFKSISPDHKLAECVHQYLPAFEHMQLILSTANEDVCSDTKTSLIESFHRNFVSKARKYRKEQKANQLVAPKLLKLFYMHYASAVSATCAQSAIKELQTFKFNETIEQSGESLIEQFSSTLGKLDASNGYKDMFLVWNFVDSLPVEQDSKLSRYLHEGKTRVYLQVQKAEGLIGIQDSCRQKLRPIYSLSLLPVIRLADLGFYPEDESLAQLLSKHPKYRELYSLVQLCETILPIYVIENEKLSADQVVVLPKDQVDSIHVDIDAGESIVRYNPANKVVALKNVAGDDSQVFIKKVKANVNSRVSEQSKILKRMIRKYKSKSSSGTDKIVLSQGHSEGEDLTSLIHEKLSTDDELASLKVLENEEDTDDKSGAEIRKKRSVMSFFKNTLAYVAASLATIVFVALWILLMAFKVLILAPPTLIWMMSGTSWKPKGLKTAWETKVPFFPTKVYESIAA